MEQQKPQPGDEAAEVVGCGGEDCVDGIAARMGERIAAHAMVVLEMANDRLDSGASLQLSSVKNADFRLI